MTSHNPDRPAPPSAARCAWCPRPAVDPPLCGACLAAAGRDIAALALDHRDLGALVPERTGPADRVTGTRSPSVPLDLVADALQRDIAWQCAVWEPPVREVAGLDPAPEVGVRPARLVNRAVRVLSGHVSDFSRLPATWGYPDGIEAGCVARSGLYGVSSMRRLHARCLTALDLGPPPAPVRVPGYCAACGRAALTRIPGDGTPIGCSHCHTGITEDQYLNGILITTPSIHPNG